MNHPKPDEWVPYIYGEATPENRRRLKDHMQTCEPCRNEIQSWQRSRGRLDSWKVPANGKAPERTAGVFTLSWAAGTAVLLLLALVLGAGIALGRFTSPTASVEKMQEALEPRLRQQIHDELARTTPAMLATASKESRELLNNFTRALENKHTEEAQAIYSALEKMENQRLADYLALKKDLDTVALNTDAVLRHTEQQLVQLVDSTQVDPANSHK